MLVGAAAEQPRKQPLASTSFFRGHRGGDTGEMEPVPGDPADVDPETLRYAPQPPRRFGWFRRILALVVLLAVVVGAGALAYSWSQKQYYVAVADEKVAIYRGIQADLPGVTLHRVEETSDVTVQSLPAYAAERVRAGIPADDLKHAREIAAEIRTDFARMCPTPEPSPTAEPSKSASRSPSADGSKKAGARDGSKAAASPTPSPSPSPSPTIVPPECVEPSPSDASAAAPGAGS
jgi:protein phosphatase